MTKTEVPCRVVSYSRVSTSEQAISGLGLEAQRTAIQGHVDSHGWQISVTVVDDGVSGTVGVDKRPALADALGALDRSDADVLVVAKLDRLSRSMSDFARLAQRAIDRKWAIVALDIGVDTTSPSGELVANMMAAVAQHEARLVSQRTRDALRVLRHAGVRLGRPVELPGSVRDRIAERHEAGCTLRAICDELERDGVATAHGGRWWPSTVRAVIRSRALDRLADDSAGPSHATGLGSAGPVAQPED